MDLPANPDRGGPPPTIGWFPETVSRKKAALAGRVAEPLGRLAEECLAVWGDPARLDAALTTGIAALPGCSLLYALEPDGRQRSANIGPDGTAAERRGQDLSRRPYLSGALPHRGMLLSNAYLNRRDGQVCITAVQALSRDRTLLGFIAADFHLTELKLAAEAVPYPLAWQQFRGDPAIRGGLFAQSRTVSAMDERLEEVLQITEALLSHHGVFHAKLHLSSSRATVWALDDPYHYRLHTLAELVDPAICLAYGQHPYPRGAALPMELIGPVLRLFSALRLCDETLYLRSGSLNIMNGMVGLNFSCDGSHYIPAREFIEKDLAFWLGGR